MYKSVLTALAAIAAAPALADPGLHHHPHGIAAGWIVAAAVLVVAPGVLLAVRKARK